MRDIAHHMAAFMITIPKDVRAITTFTQFLGDCIGHNQLGNALTKQWRTVISEYVSRVSNISEQDLNRGEWYQTGLVLKGLDEAGYSGMLDRAGYCFYCAGELQKAVECWERGGTTQKNEYYLAKAEVIRFPDGLEWLERARAHDRIIAEWEKAGGLDGVSDSRWLRFAALALERKDRYQEALHVYMRLDDITKVLECIAKVGQNIGTSDPVPLVDYLIRRDRWIDAIEAIDKSETIGRDAEKERLRCDVVREFAYSELIPEGITVDDRQRYEKFINRVLSTRDWQQYLSVREVGTALERTGQFGSTLQFYERFVSARETELRKFARERWIVTKRGQEDYYRNQSKKEAKDERAKDAEKRAEQIKIELANRVHDWGIRADIDLPPYPALEARGVKGLPLGTKVERLADGSLRFQIGSVEVRINKDTRLVLLTDTRDFKALRVDFVQGQLSGLEQQEFHQETGESQLSFEVSASGYSGKASFGGEKPRLELKLQNLQGSISLEL